MSSPMYRNRHSDHLLILPLTHSLMTKVYIYTVCHYIIRQLRSAYMLSLMLYSYSSHWYKFSIKHLLFIYWWFDCIVYFNVTIIVIYMLISYINCRTIAWYIYQILLIIIIIIKYLLHYYNLIFILLLRIILYYNCSYYSLYNR